MSRTLMPLGLKVALLALFLAGCADTTKQAAAPAVKEQPKDAWRETFTVDKKNLASTGDNPYFPLRPGYRLHLAGGKDTLIVSVLDETKVVDGVETRVVEEREEKDGKLAEISRNFFAIDKTTKDLYYFGEDVDNYKDGKIVSHESAWLAGKDGAKFGLFLPGAPKVGDRFYQELAPKVAMDRFEIVSLDATLETPAGKFEKCLRAKESTPLESDVADKVFAPGVGMIKDDEFVLVKVEKPGK